MLAFFKGDEHAVIRFRRADAVDAGDGGDDDDVAAFEEGARGAHPEFVELVVDGGFLVDVNVGGGNVSFGLVKIVIADEIFDGVFGEERFELVVELRGECFVVREDESGPVAGFDQLGHRKCFAGTGDAEQYLVLVAGFDAARELFDSRGLIATGLIIAAQLEVHGRGLPARISRTAETFIILLDANRCG